MTENKVTLFYLDNELAYAYIPYDFALNRNIKGLFGPSHLSWRKEIDFSTPLEHLSHNSQKRIEKAITYAQTELGYKFDTVELLSREDFREWLTVYQRTMEQKESGTVKLSEKWFDVNPKVKNYCAFFVRNKEGQMIGGVLIEKTLDHISCSYRAHDYLKIKDSSISAIIEYFIDKFALDNGYKLITRGVDSNIYGIRLGMGLHDFKVQYGFKPFPMDYSSNYTPRVLVLFKDFKKIMTYVYTETKSITPIIIEGEALLDYVVDKEIIMN